MNLPSVTAALGLLRAVVADKWAKTEAPPYAALGRLESSPWEGFYVEEAY